ncbi:MAG: sulfatase-like hydrolase/transferase [Pirellulaceae bacterium]
MKAPSRSRCLWWVGVACWCVTSHQAWASGPPRRNVVLVTFDDLRQDTPGFNGGPAKTPHMDRLAKISTNFRNAMTTVGLCSPSRATLFTGRYGHQTGLDDNCHVWHSRLDELDDNETTLIEWSRKAGYFVGYFGKWHLGRGGPTRRGAHRPAIKTSERPRKQIYRKPDGYNTIRRYYEPGRTFGEKPEYYGTRKGTYGDTGECKTSRGAIAFLKEAADRDRPFFLCVNYHGPHPPYRVPIPYNKMYAAREVSLPGNFLHRSDDKPRYQNDPLWYWHDVGHLTELDWRKMNSHYWGFVSLVDRALGQLLGTLDELQLSDNTMVVLVGDQGSMLGEHALYDKGPYCYDELMRIPLLIRVPAARPGTVHRQVSIIDINQTIVDWLALEPDNKQRFSRSLLPLVRQESDAWHDVPDAAFYRYEWYNGKWYGIRAVRTPRWKYCWNPVGIDELYDMKNDAEETLNRINDPQVAGELKRLQRQLLAHLEETGDPAADRFRIDAN